MKIEAIEILEKIEERNDVTKWYVGILILTLQKEDNQPVIFRDEFNFKEGTEEPTLKLTAGIFEKDKKGREKYDRILFPISNKNGWWYDKCQEWYPTNIITVKTEKDLDEWKKLIVNQFKSLE